MTFVKQFEAALKQAERNGVDLTNPEAVKAYMKDTFGALPTGTDTRPTSGWLYQNGPFSASDDLISSAIAGGSPILNWIPSRGVTHRFDNIAHLEWVAPDGFDGSTDYRTYLANLNIEDCDYGPHFVWSGFEYEQQGGRWSFTSPVLGINDFGVRDYENSPIYTVRGDMIGVALNTDADWATARALIGLEQHMNYNIIYGDRQNSVMEMDGIDTVIQQGYVQNHRVGPGTPHWADPLVANGAAINTPAELLTTIRALIRKLRTRALARNWSVAANDMIVLMPAAMWPYVADAQASGAFAAFTAWSGVSSMDMTPRDFLAERQRVTSGGLGFGIIDIDGQPVAVVPDANLGRNVTIDPGGVNEAPGVSGDIYILTRRAAGMQLLEQQYLNWDELSYPTNAINSGNESTFTLFNGLVRAGWKVLNNKCFQYYVEQSGRLTSMFQPMQARINNVTLETLLESEMEAGAFWSPDFYAYDGTQGHAGAALLTEI